MSVSSPRGCDKGGGAYCYCLYPCPTTTTAVEEEEEEEHEEGCSMMVCELLHGSVGVLFVCCFVLDWLGRSGPRE